MRQSPSKTPRKDASAPPQKKVTFFGPVVPTKGERLQYVGTSAAPSRRTVMSAALRPRLPKNPTIQPPQNLQPQFKDSRFSKPHSKITVTGTPMKTRLNCNHLRPKCQCTVIASKNRSGRVRQKSGTVSSRPKQILTSTRSLPRGELNGRKSYKETGTGKSVSVLDANWQPGLDIYAEDSAQKESGSDQFPSDTGKENGRGSKESYKKKVQFAENTNHHSESDKNVVKPRDNNSNLYDERENMSSQEYKMDRDKYKKLPTSKVSRINQADLDNDRDPSESQSTSGYRSQSRRVLNDDGSSVARSQRRETPPEYCRLCESLECSYPHSSVHDRAREYRGGEYSSKYADCKDYDDSEPCLLCSRYGRHHAYSDIYSCKLCDRSDQACVYSDVDRHAEYPSTRKSRSPLHRKLSAPELSSSESEEETYARKIPYEPRTELVKDLKEKLEAEYRNKEYMLRQNKLRRKLKQWDKEDLETLRQFRRCDCRRAWDCDSHHKCVHRYLQNERLFLEPTLINKRGRSVCAECGAPQPTDPRKNPYLYHITLGGLKDQDSGVGSSGKEDKGCECLSDEEELASKVIRTPRNSRKPLRDTSKHIFAKMNKNISSVLPGGSGYFRHSSATDARRYRNEPHAKRHPSKSMALVDHIV